MKNKLSSPACAWPRHARKELRYGHRLPTSNCPCTVHRHITLPIGPNPKSIENNLLWLDQILADFMTFLFIVQKVKYKEEWGERKKKSRGLKRLYLMGNS
uniref:Uncharacterized protein n=1 Tax=Cacopsylla melanoneura TaxID=428564 RepID=A0A8D8QKK5_9HEMI